MGRYLSVFSTFRYFASNIGFLIFSWIFMSSIPLVFLFFIDFCCCYFCVQNSISGLNVQGIGDMFLIFTSYSAITFRTSPYTYIWWNVSSRGKFPTYRILHPIRNFRSYTDNLPGRRPRLLTPYQIGLPGHGGSGRIISFPLQSGFRQFWYLS